LTVTPRRRARSRESRAMAGEYRYDAFISYREVEPDREFARKLLRDLETAGYQVVLRDRFEPQATLLEEMERCVRESRFTLAVLSPRYLEAGETEHQALIAALQNMQEQSRRLIPVTMEPTSRPLWLV